MSDNILNGLTESQCQAVTHKDGPMLVVAGAGSGKTRVVTSRIAWLISQGVRPHQILAMTFTNKAAGEMKSRVAQMVGEAPRNVGTFHSLCARFLRFDLDRLDEGRDGRFTIFDGDDQLSLFKQIFKEQSIDDKRFKPKSFGTMISKAKSDMILPRDYGDGSYNDDVVRRVYESYEQRLRDMNALDFDDLLVLTARMLRKLPDLCEEYRRRYRYLLIDEYQDTNKAQYTLMRLLCNEDNNVHVTGDPDQSIYSWRGADYANIMDFQKDFPEAKVVRLERNYRSSGNILSAANKIIKFNTDRIEKNLYTEGERGEPVGVIALESDREEAEWIAEQAARLKGEGTPFSRMAVFYRTNAQSRIFEESLMSASIPYQIIGGVRFYERKEIKDILAHLKIIVNTRDDIALRRITNARATGVGEKTLAKVFLQASERQQSPFEFLASEDFVNVFRGTSDKVGSAPKKLRDFAYFCQKLRAVPFSPVGEAVQKIADISGLKDYISGNTKDHLAEDRIENIDAFINRAFEFEAKNPEADLPQFLEDVALIADVDSYDPNADNIVLMTLHSAKGLEFPVVFLAGLENGLLPHANSQGSVNNQDEERRLFYVGITRAEQKLFITHAARRMMWGKVEYSTPSPFLSELPHNEIQCLDLSSRQIAGYSSKSDPFDMIDDEFDISVDDDFADPFIDEFAPNPNILKKKEKKNSQIFKAGEHVAHKSFGKGKVLSCSKNHAVVQFFEGGTRMLSLTNTVLSRV